MSEIKEAYIARKEAEESGVWVDLLAGEIKIKAVARNKEFSRLIQGVTDGQRISDDKLFDKLVTACGKTVVVDWDGFEIDYSPESFADVCNDLKECGFLEDVLALAMDKEMFNQVAVAQAAKN